VTAQDLVGGLFVGEEHQEANEQFGDD